MQRFPNGSVLYDDSPWFIEIVLFISAIGIGAMAWVSATQLPPHYFAAAVLGFFAIMCVVGMFTQQYHRSYLFNPRTSEMTWKIKGILRQSSGVVAFKDIGVTLDTSTSSDSAVTYRVMLTTPAGSMPLTRSYDGDRKGTEEQAASLRAMLGQTSASLQDDSVSQMARSGNKIGAISALRAQSPMSLEDAVQRVNDEGSTH